MIRILRTVLAIASTCVLAACGQSPSESADGKLSGKLILTGSSTVAPLATEIAKRFESLHPDVRVDVQTGGSGQGIADARHGTADIGMASRELKSSESDLTAHRLAADGVGLIVHKDNPVQQLGDDQVVAIYTDRINNWKDVGGPDLPIQVVHKAEGRATLEVFLKHFKIENPSVKADVIVGHNEQGIKTVAGAPGSIGYVSIGTAEADVKAGGAIRLLPLGGVEATTQTVSSGKFPMSRPLILVTGAKTSSLAKAFIDYAQSEAVHDLVTAHFFVPIRR